MRKIKAIQILRIASIYFGEQYQYNLTGGNTDEYTASFHAYRVENVLTICTKQEASKNAPSFAQIKSATNFESVEVKNELDAIKIIAQKATAFFDGLAAEIKANASLHSKYQQPKYT